MRLRPQSAILVAAALAACGGAAERGSDEGGRLDAAMNREGGTGDGSPRDAHGPDGSDSLRFVVMGDTGTGETAQRQVAIAVRDYCEAHGCDFAILLGDIIYEAGVDGPDDPQWKSKFEEPYRDLDMPFYGVLGNHDYGGELFGTEQGGLGNEWEKGPYQVAYAKDSDKFRMPDTHYTFTRANVGFVMLDTNSIMWDNTEHGDQRAWYPKALEKVSDKEWVFAAGHHPVRSNGTHGNAGDYESIEVGGTEIPNPVPILDGENVKKFFDEVVCGTVSVYFAGHDHNRQWLDEPDALCGAELIVSGAGAKLRDQRRGSNDAHYEEYATEGFLHVVVEGDTLTGRFVDKHGKVGFERTVTH